MYQYSQSRLRARSSVLPEEEIGVRVSTGRRTETVLDASGQQDARTQDSGCNSLLSAGSVKTGSAITTRIRPFRTVVGTSLCAHLRQADSMEDATSLRP
nr:hypothetical protein CFP56_16480 [Quercus suber]